MGDAEAEEVAIPLSSGGFESSDGDDEIEVEVENEGDNEDIAEAFDISPSTTFETALVPSFTSVGLLPPCFQPLTAGLR